jgi:hypothetical protein
LLLKLSLGIIRLGIRKMSAYDIFSGTPTRGALWLECVEGRQQAYERMKERAAENPGPYFLFDASSGSPIASFDTSASKASKPDSAFQPWWPKPRD